MPFNPDYPDFLADLSAIYSDAELTLLRMIDAAIFEGRETPDWVERKLLQIGLLQTRTIALTKELEAEVWDEIADKIARAYNRGQAVAVGDLDRALQRNSGYPGVPPVEGIVKEMYGNLQNAHGHILRSVTDLYQNVIGWSAAQVNLGVMTRRQAAHRALVEFSAEYGITGFTDRRGRRWNMTSYVEMAMRTSTANAATAGHVDRLILNGHDLVQVSDAPQECKKCRPWEKKILTLMGVQAPPPGVRVAGSLTDAKRDGLFHPGCRHSIAVYIPGVTKTPPASRTADPQGDADRQKLRYLERQVRKWKRIQSLEEAYGDKAALKDAGAKVRGYQARIREHVDSTTAKRQPQRERLGTL